MECSSANFRVESISAQAHHYHYHLIPRRFADVVLLVSLPFVILVIRFAGAKAVSLQSQSLLLLAFLLRYLDLFRDIATHASYRSIFKIAYIVLATTNVFLLSLLKIRSDRAFSWPTIAIPIVVVSAILALPLHYKESQTWLADALEFAWAMSEYVGGLAVVPQLILSWHQRFPQAQDRQPVRVHRTMFIYLSMLLTHQVLYILNWILRSFLEHTVDPISIVAGVFRACSIIFFLVRYAVRDPEGQLRLT